MTKLSLPVGAAGQKNRGWITGRGRHSGIDYGWYNADPTNSKRIYAAAPGKVVSVYNGGGWNKGWGCRVIIQHATGVRTAYNHFWANGIRVAVGQTVAAGTYLGQMGSTGDSQGTHLHFELYRLGFRINPAPYFSKDLPGTSSMFKDQRKTANTVANVRADATTDSKVLTTLKPNTIYTMAGYSLGQRVDGLNLWYVMKDGSAVHCSSFLKPHNTSGLKKVIPKAAAEAAAKVAAEATAKAAADAKAKVAAKVAADAKAKVAANAKADAANKPQPQPQPEKEPMKKDTSNTDAAREVAEAINELADNEAIQAIKSPLLARIPVKIRARIYEAGKWLGLAGAAGLAIAGVLTGDAERYAQSAGLLALSVSNFVAKSNLS
jgi:hypothetical protein